MKFMSKFIQAIERRDLISLCQSWIVEHRVAEIFDRPSHRQNCLTDVYNLGRSLSDDVHAQQFQRIRVKQNFQEPLVCVSTKCASPSRTVT
jgi:hypothetical protein